MQALESYFGGRSSSFYYGDRGDWLVLYTVHRDSGDLDRSNFRCLERDGLNQWGNSVDVERAGHWFCGWVDFLIVDPRDSRAVAWASEWERALALYPVVDDEDWANLETEDAQATISGLTREDAIQCLMGEYGYDPDTARLELADWVARGFVTLAEVQA